MLSCDSEEPLLQPCLGSKSTCDTLDVLHDAVLELQLTFSMTLQSHLLQNVLHGL